MYLTCMYHTLYYDRSAAVAVYIQFLFMYKKPNIIVYYDIHKEDTQTNKTKKSNTMITIYNRWIISTSLQRCLYKNKDIIQMVLT